MSTVASCIVKSATTLQWTVNSSFYSLAQVGGLLLGITNPCIFETEESHVVITVCPRHRWRRNNSRCSSPTEVAAHKGKSSAPEAQYGLKRGYSAHVMSATNMLVQECSRICLNGFLEKRFFICVISVRQISTP